MPKVRSTLVFLVAAFLTFSATAAAGYYRYAGPSIFSPGEFRDSYYDWRCDRWYMTEMNKDRFALGTVTFIDANGNWHYTVRSYGSPTQTATFDFLWTKKAHCRNSSAIAYWANC